ncbi:hypothetical protein HK097_003890, partial [Rhizophlyctis rosea]
MPQMTYLVPMQGGMQVPHMAPMQMVGMNMAVGVGMGMPMQMPMGMMQVPAGGSYAQPHPMGGYVVMQQVMVPAEHAGTMQQPQPGQYGMMSMAMPGMPAVPAEMGFAGMPGVV